LLQGTELADLLDPIGTLACKVPRSVKLAEVMQKLTGTLGSLTLEQLKKLPELIQATITVQPAALEVCGTECMCGGAAVLL
jgi:hypothetical protein